MSFGELSDFFSKSVDERLNIFNNFSSDEKKNFLEKMSFNELMDFISSVNYDKKIINYISSNKINRLFQLFPSDKRKDKFSFLKNLDNMDILFERLSLEEKREFLKSLSILEVDDFLYNASNTLRNSIYNALGPDYIRENISNFSLRSARIIISKLSSEISKKEIAVSNLENRLTSLKKNKKNNNLITSISSSLTNMNESLNKSRELLNISVKGQKAHNDLINNEVSNFSKAVANIYGRISEDDVNRFKKTSRLMHAEEDLVRHLFQYGFISSKYFNIVVQNLSDEEKQVFRNFTDRANNIMMGKEKTSDTSKQDVVKDDATKDDDNNRDNGMVDNDKQDKKIILPQLKNNISFEKHIEMATMDLYTAAGYGKNAFGWYFDPSVDDYMEDYNPLYDPLFNVFISEENRIKAMEEYNAAGYGKNSFGWYFDPSVDDYVEGYDPTLDSLFNKSVPKNINKISGTNNTSALKDDENTYSQTNTKITVEKLIELLNKYQKNFGVSFVSIDDLKNNHDFVNEGVPIIAVSQKEKQIFMEFVNWKKNEKDSFKIKDVVEKIHYFMNKSEEFGVSFININSSSIYSWNNCIIFNFSFFRIYSIFILNT